MTVLFGVFIYWGLLNSDDVEIFELCGVFKEYDEAQNYIKEIDKELQCEENHSFSHAIIKPIEIGVKNKGEYSR